MNVNIYSDIRAIIPKEKIKFNIFILKKSYDFSAFVTNNKRHNSGPVAGCPSICRQTISCIGRRHTTELKSPKFCRQIKTKSPMMKGTEYNILAIIKYAVLLEPPLHFFDYFFNDFLIVTSAILDILCCIFNISFFYEPLHHQYPFLCAGRIL